MGDVFSVRLKGTSANTFAIGKGGPLVKNNSGVLEAKNNDDSAYANFSAADVVLNKGASTATLTGNFSVPRTIIIQDDSGTVAFLSDIGPGGSLWQRVGTELSPLTGGDDVAVTGDLFKIGGSGATPDVTFTTISTALMNVAMRVSGDQTFEFGIRGSGGTVPRKSIIGSAGWKAASTSNNQPGVDTDIVPGPPTGDSLSLGDVHIKASVQGASGTTPQALDDVAIFHIGDTLGRISFGTAQQNVWEVIAQNNINLRGSIGGVHTFHLGFRGQAATPPNDIVIRSGYIANSTASNLSGTDYTSISGPGTGNQIAKGDHIWQTPNIGASGTTVQSVTTKMTLFREGELRLLSSGSVSLPALAIGNETDTGSYMISVNRPGYTVSGARAFDFQRGATDILKVGRPGAGAITPLNFEVRVSGYESASSSADQVGTRFDQRSGPGTGLGTPGGFRFQTYSPLGGTSTAIQTTFKTVIDVDHEGNIQFGTTANNDIQTNIGINISHPADLDGPAIILGAVSVEPSAGIAGALTLYTDGTNLFYFTAGGVKETVAVV